MGKTAQDDGDIFGVVGFLSHFSDLTDGRHAGKVVYPLDEVLLLAVLAVLAGAGTLTDIASVGGIFAALDAGRLGGLVTGLPAGVIAIDGKTCRRSVGEKDGKVPSHMGSASAARQRLVPGQVKGAKNLMRS